MKKLPTIFKLLLLAILGIIIYFVFIKSPSGKAGALAPDFEAELIDGTNFKLSDLRGSFVLLDFWGSWCPPCRKDNPNLVALHSEFKDARFDNADSFEMVTVALEKNAKRNKAAADKDGFTWKYQIVQESRYVLTAPLALKYGISNVPSKYLIGPKGDILGVNLSKNEIREILKTHLQ